MQFKVDIVSFMSQDLGICIVVFKRCETELIKTLNISKEHGIFCKDFKMKPLHNKPRENVKGLVAPYEGHTCSLGLALISFA